MAELILGRFEKLRLLGEGGFGKVWAVRDLRLGRDVALKVLYPRVAGSSTAALEQRFEREARLTARLNHPGIPVVHDQGRLDDDRLYLVMELVPGDTLSALLRQHGPLPLRLASSIAADTADVLAHAHSMHIVHRDLKPSNIMLTPHGTVKVLDFGIAAALEPDPDEPRITGSNATPGTPGYMAPEQAMGCPSERSDLYALGCVLYELLAGVPPLTAPHPAAMLYKLLHEQPVSLAEHRRDLPNEVVEVVMGLLTKDPDRRRPDSAAEVSRLARLWTPPSPPPDLAPATPRVAPKAEAELPATASPRVASLAPPRDELRRAGEPPRQEFSSASDRLEQSRQLLHEGEPGRAYEGFFALGAELRRARPATDREVLECRLGVSRCLAALGRTAEALLEFEALLPVEAHALGPHNPQVFDTRYEIAVLRARSGDRGEARDLLLQLAADQRNALAADDDRHERVAGLIARLEHLLREGEAAQP